MTDTISPAPAADEPFVTDRKNRLFLEVVTIDGHEYTVDKDDVFVRMGEDHPSLRPHVVSMFERAGDSLAGMRYPANIADLPVNDATIGFVADLLDLMPFDDDARSDAADHAVATLIECSASEEALAVHRLASDAIDKM